MLIKNLEIHLHYRALYDENLELAKCLREKGLNVPDPIQQEPKVDLSGLKEELAMFV